MTTLYFEKISRFDRQREPASISIPLARGRQFDDKYTSLVLYAAVAAPNGYLDWFDYPY